MFIFSTDINECEEGTNGKTACDRNAKCKDFIGSFECTCNEGFEGDGKTCSGRLFFFKPTSNQLTKDGKVRLFNPLLLTCSKS